jgi:hypothetical protein
VGNLQSKAQAPRGHRGPAIAPIDVPGPGPITATSRFVEPKGRRSMLVLRAGFLSGVAGLVGSPAAYRSPAAGP